MKRPYYYEFEKFDGTFCANIKPLDFTPYVFKMHTNEPIESRMGLRPNTKCGVCGETMASHIKWREHEHARWHVSCRDVFVLYFRGYSTTYIQLVGRGEMAASYVLDDGGEINEDEI